ncbi:MAG: cytochrome c3 family protein [Desulfosudaceae bacterium]
MKKISLLIIVSTVIMVVAALAAEKNQGPAELVIPGGSKADVPLPHRVHQEALDDCDSCHNLFPQAGGSIVEYKADGTLKKMQVMKQCQGCHRERGKAGQKAGPISCGDCHVE